MPYIHNRRDTCSPCPTGIMNVMCACRPCPTGIIEVMCACSVHHHPTKWSSPSHSRGCVFCGYWWDCSNTGQLMSFRDPFVPGETNYTPDITGPQLAWRRGRCKLHVRQQCRCAKPGFECMTSGRLPGPSGLLLHWSSTCALPSVGSRDLCCGSREI